MIIMKDKMWCDRQLFEVFSKRR